MVSISAVFDCLMNYLWSIYICCNIKKFTNFFQIVWIVSFILMNDDCLLWLVLFYFSSDSKEKVFLQIWSELIDNYDEISNLFRFNEFSWLKSFVNFHAIARYEGKKEIIISNRGQWVITYFWTVVIDSRFSWLRPGCRSCLSASQSLIHLDLKVLRNNWQL